MDKTHKDHIEKEIWTQLEIMGAHLDKCKNGQCLEFIKVHAKNIESLCDAGLSGLRSGAKTD